MLTKLETNIYYVISHIINIVINKIGNTLFNKSFNPVTTVHCVNVVICTLFFIDKVNNDFYMTLLDYIKRKP